MPDQSNVTFASLFLGSVPSEAILGRVICELTFAQPSLRLCGVCDYASSHRCIVLIRSSSVLAALAVQPRLCHVQCIVTVLYLRFPTGDFDRSESGQGSEGPTEHVRPAAGAAQNHCRAGELVVQL